MIPNSKTIIVLTKEDNNEYKWRLYEKGKGIKTSTMVDPFMKYIYYDEGKGGYYIVENNKEELETILRERE